MTDLAKILTASIEAEKERRAWLEDRKTGIGATDASAIAGVNPWRQPGDVYLSKLPHTQEATPSFKMQLGLLLEPALAQLYERETGAKLLKAPMMSRHSVRSWQIASLDYIREDGAKNVELKTTDDMFRDEWGEPGSDEIPEVYLVQVTHQMLVTGIPITDVAVLFGTREFRVYTVELNLNLGDVLTDMEDEFWRNHVQARVPPPVDWGDARTPRIVQALYPPVGGRVELDQDHLELIQRYESLREDSSKWDAEREVIKAKIALALNGSTEGLLPDGRLVSRKLVSRRAYEVPQSEYVDFRIKEPKTRGKK